MADAQRIDAATTALLVMDFQNDIVGMLPEPARAPVVANAAAVLTRARALGLAVIHVVVRFRDGYPEVSPRNKGFSALKAAGRLREGTSGAEPHATLAPAAGEPVVVKRRVSAFGTTDLDALLRAKGIETLILVGLVTGGVVLSTLRHAADHDYAIIVASNACADPDEEVHRVLVGKVFPRQATVVTTEALLGMLAAPK